MLNPTAQTILERLLEILIGGITILTFKLKMGSGGVSLKDMIKELEEKDREIERLKIEVHTWRIRHDHVTNKTHLHNVNKVWYG